MREIVRGDEAACARHVLDDDCGPARQMPREVRRYDPRIQVVAAARTEPDQDPDRAPFERCERSAMAELEHAASAHAATIALQAGRIVIGRPLNKSLLGENKHQRSRELHLGLDPIGQ